MKPRHLLPALFLCLLVGYPLSVGPVARIDIAMHPGRWDSSPWVYTLYSPLTYLADRVPLVDTLLRKYLTLWAPHVQPSARVRGE